LSRIKGLKGITKTDMVIPTIKPKKNFCPYCSAKLIEKEWEGQSRLYCETCTRAIYENPVPASCLVVVDSRDRLALVRRSVEPKKGYWCLPGGFMELGEAPEEAALRELEEETGLAGKIDRLLGIMSTPNAQYHTVLMVAYLVLDYKGTLVPGDDASDAAWYSHRDLPEIAFTSHSHFIMEYFGLPHLSNAPGFS
jgi:8-oxo-dGTP diphosphatase